MNPYRGPPTLRYLTAMVLILTVLAASGFALYFTKSIPAAQTKTVTSFALSSAHTFFGPIVIIPNGTAVDTAQDFTPSTIVVVVGVNNTITWFNEDASFHTVTIDTAPPGAQYTTGLVKSGGTYSLTLTVPGTYHYYCEWHPAWMRAVVIVKSA